MGKGHCRAGQAGDGGGEQKRSTEAHRRGRDGDGDVWGK